MKRTYHIHGMTCNGCQDNVEDTLLKLEGVSMASVDIEKAEVIIENSEVTVIKSNLLGIVKSKKLGKAAISLPFKVNN